MALSKRMLAIIAVLAVVVVVIIAAAALGGGNTKANDNGDNNGDDNPSEDDGATPGAGANVKIIEVESNPAGSDAGSEWLIVKNFGDSPVNITGWKLYSTGGDAQAKVLSGTLGANETMKVTFVDQFLDNEDEVVKLYSADSVLVDQTSSVTDNGNDSGTWVRP